ncbi:hypothetical protein LZ30DRAFT_343982 [Colletotrichum cereale]|nr:hypothetical protein LZ30DRAFT_343982 [Colletotrichum cereale]
MEFGHSPNLCRLPPFHPGPVPTLYPKVGDAGVQELVVLDRLLPYLSSTCKHLGTLRRAGGRHRGAVVARDPSRSSHMEELVLHSVSPNEPTRVNLTGASDWSGGNRHDCHETRACRKKGWYRHAKSTLHTIDRATSQIRISSRTLFIMFLIHHTNSVGQYFQH